MFESFNSILKTIDSFVWGLPLIILIISVGLFLTIRLKGLQITKLGLAIKHTVKNEASGDGEVSGFASLCTALSATIGTGNIVGVATALVAGGPGALFWMWIAALVGTATKYSECLLAVKYRVVQKDGHILGGPFYYIEHGMGKKWKWLAKLFAFFGVGVGLLGIGTFTQINGITSAVNNFFDANNQWAVTLFGREYSWSVIISGILLTIFTALVLIGGLKRISSVAQVIVPFMAVTYFVVTLAILVYNFREIPNALATIVQSAFGLRAVGGGAIGSMMIAMQMGVARGIFSNEAGLGSAPIAHAAANCEGPVQQGVFGIFEVFIDTILICSLTALTIIISGVDITFGEKPGSELITSAFGTIWGNKISAVFIALALMMFAYSTILGWSLYGTRCIQYLFGMKAVKPYQIFFCIIIVVGCVSPIDAVWDIADTFNGLMAIPNFIALFALSPVVFKLTKEHFAEVDRLKAK